MANKLKAKKKAIKSLKSEMKEEAHGMLDDLKGKMSVKVMADSPEDLKKGLEKAEELLEGGKDGLGGLLKEAFKKRSKKIKKED
jgi:hypothetical protein